MSRGDYAEYRCDPAFIDLLAVDIVVIERKYMKLTAAEKLHAAHRLHDQGLGPLEISEIMRITARTVCRLLSAKPPPILDVDECGRYVDDNGQLCQGELVP